VGGTQDLPHRREGVQNRDRHVPAR
jgi:hypothetical protein